MRLEGGELEIEFGESDLPVLRTPNGAPSVSLISPHDSRFAFVRGRSEGSGVGFKVRLSLTLHQ